MVVICVSPVPSGNWGMLGIMWNKGNRSLGCVSDRCTANLWNFSLLWLCLCNHSTFRVKTFPKIQSKWEKSPLIFLDGWLVMPREECRTLGNYMVLREVFPERSRRWQIPLWTKMFELLMKSSLNAVGFWLSHRWTLPGRTLPVKIPSFSALWGRGIGLEKKPSKGKCSLWSSSWILIFSPGFLQLSGGSSCLGRDWKWIYSFGVTGFVLEGGPTSVGNGLVQHLSCQM